MMLPPTFSSLFIWYSYGVIECQIKYALPCRAVARILFVVIFYKNFSNEVRNDKYIYIL